MNLTDVCDLNVVDSRNIHTDASFCCEGANSLRLATAFFVSLFVAVSLVGKVEAGSFVQLSKPAQAPTAWANFCGTHKWACAWTSSGDVKSEKIMVLIASEVNHRVNSKVRRVSDSEQYRRKDYWTLPTARGGDCEDFALLKKKLLIERGLAPDRLLISTVLDRSNKPHAVLVMRTNTRDLVLDNLTDEMKRWDRTGYSFLKIQDGGVTTGWRLAMQGGIFR